MDIRKPKTSIPRAWHDETEVVRDGEVVEDPRKLFDVTCVIGSVYDGGQEDPTVVAFRLIAQHKADGTFTFPNADLETVSVTVHTSTTKR